MLFDISALLICITFFLQSYIYKIKKTLKTDHLNISIIIVNKKKYQI